MNVVLLTGRLTRDPELRNLASGRAVTQFGIATNEYVRSQEKSEFHNVVTWGKLAEICGQYLTKGQQVALEGRLQTRSWDDDRGVRHWKTEVVADRVEMLGGRRKKDYDAEAAAHNLEQQAAAMGEEWVSPRVAARLDALHRALTDNKLTQREVEVLRLIAFGHTSVEIARMLHLSPRTIETHRAHIHKKLGLKSRAELVRYSLRRGLIGA